MRKRFERFCLKNRNKGIPNLMLYIVIGTGIVSILRSVGLFEIYSMLMFNRMQILKGQVWRLFTWILLDGRGTPGGLFMDLIMLYCYYSLGKAMESAWGTFRFNLFYLSGILMMDVFAMTLGGMPIFKDYPNTYLVDNMLNQGWTLYALNMADMLHLSLLIGFATLYKDARFVIFFVIPIKAGILALLYLIIIGVQVIQLSVPIMYFPHNLFPLIGMLNYFLFFGKDVLSLLPGYTPKPRQVKTQYAPKKPIHFGKTEHKPKGNYLHRCTVCGKTDVTNPELEFRYCSRCNGYFCYCEDHINNHTHVE